MTLFDRMVDEFMSANAVGNDNAVREIMQRVALAGLARGGFFDRAAFYGGTCLHLLFGLDRYSEDLDFSLLEPDRDFDFETFFPAIAEEFKLVGKDVEIKLKHKGRPTSIASAFLKETSDVFDIGFTTEKRLKVKIEVDVDPPLKFTTTEKTINTPRICWVRTFDLPGLFAGKVSAVLFRKWKERIKGRDWYDVLWYLAREVELDLEHLVERAKQCDPRVDVSSREALIAALDQKIESVDFENAKLDVLNYVRDQYAVSSWSRKLFHQAVRDIRIKREKK